MSNYDMLGKLMKMIVGLPSETIGPLHDLAEKLWGKEGGDWLTALKRFLRKENPWEKPLFKNDKAKDGWKLLEDVPFDGKQFVPKFVEFLKSGEPCIDGEEMKRRALKLNVNSGQHDAEYLLENKKSIPKELRDKCLIFPGTVWLDHLGRRCVPCLFWGGSWWYLSFRYLALSMYENDRLVSSRE